MQWDKLILLFTALLAKGQPFDANTNTVIAPVVGPVYVSDDGTNWTPVMSGTGLPMMVRFDMADTNVPGQNTFLIHTQSIKQSVMKAKLDATVAQARFLDMAAARGWTKATWHMVASNGVDGPVSVMELSADGNRILQELPVLRPQHFVGAVKIPQPEPRPPEPDADGSTRRASDQPVSRVAQSFSDEQVNATWAIRCPVCGKTSHIAVKTAPPTVEIVK